MSAVVLRYHEIALKRGSRSRFVSKLARNVRVACAGLPVSSVADRDSRVVVHLDDDDAWPELRERLRRVYGVANFHYGKRLPISAIRSEAGVDLSTLRDHVLREIEGRRFESFRVVTKRSDKRFPVGSPEVSGEIGAAVGAKTGARVDLKGGELTITIEIMPADVFVSVERVEGAGGLPVGTAGRVLTLLSGGIDSPVAAARMLRRGCAMSFVHFHGGPYADQSSREKARELVGTLMSRMSHSRLWIVPFGDVQREIVNCVPPRPRVVLYRRMMMRIASRLADRTKAQALVTGDSLGQVASQTMKNLALVEDAATLPVYRPLIGMDKLEVTDEARALGTYEISVQPDQDCCSLFVPKHPATGGRIPSYHALEALYDVEALTERAIAATEEERYRFAGSRSLPRGET